MEPTHFATLYPITTRFKEIQKILTWAKEGNSCQVIGLPGVGRTNILELLAYNKALREHHLGDITKWFHFVLVNFSEIRSRNLLDTTKFLFLNLVDSLRERNMQEEYQKAHEIFKESLSLGDELVLFQGLKQVIDLLAIEKELTIIFLFDRFEEYIPMLTPEFFSNLRVLRNRAKYRFSVVLSLNRPLDDLVEQTIVSDFFEFLSDHTVYLPLADRDGLAFRIAYLEKVTGKTIDKKMQEHVIHITHGHGKITRLCFETILSNTYQQSNEATLISWLLSQKTIHGALTEIWKALRPSEQYLLTHPSNETHPYLEAVGLFEHGSLCIPLFAAFLKQQIAQPIQQTIIFDATRNEIKKGDMLLSDELTSAEFRLLLFLLAHPEQLVTREEIISAVWQNDATTAGVTDQALDQLIFRVRRKIEDDPNNPQHLQTIKGRGFRFLP